MLLLISFLVQGLVMMIDEFYFHRKRGLPRWERIGHPLDTMTVILCLSYVKLSSFNEYSCMIYFALFIFSCLVVTKDEWVHQRLCSPFEQWLHALLFILHPVVLFMCGYVWKMGGNLEILNIQLLVLFGFLIYQIVYWNFYVDAKD